MKIWVGCVGMDDGVGIVDKITSLSYIHGYI